MDRREFVRTAGIAAAGAALASQFAQAGEPHRQMQTRPLGRTGWNASIVVMGGIVVMSEEQERANEVVAHAIAEGVNYFDVAPSYGDAELKLGEALKPYRKDVFLACKTAQRTKDGAAREMEASFKRLQTDHFDLYQLHGLDKLEELEVALGPGGAMEVILEARKAGHIKHIGITGHKPATHLEAVRRFPFDTVMLPVNFALMHRDGSAQDLLAELKRREIGVLGIKPIAARPWHKDEVHTSPKCWYKPLDDPRLIDLALRFALMQDITAAVPSGDPHLFRRVLVSARNYKPLAAGEKDELTRLADGLEPIFS
jgi:predicted aldo/keto reductase-like oxidoreductase